MISNCYFNQLLIKTIDILCLLHLVIFLSNVWLSFCKYVPYVWICWPKFIVQSFNSHKSLSVGVSEKIKLSILRKILLKIVEAIYIHKNNYCLSQTFLNAYKRYVLLHITVTWLCAFRHALLFKTYLIFFFLLTPTWWQLISVKSLDYITWIWIIFIHILLPHLQKDICIGEKNVI